MTLRVRTLQTGFFTSFKMTAAVFLLLAVAQAFSLVEVRSRFITPNNDGKNDRAVMVVDNPEDASFSAKIYDMEGRFLADMTVSSTSGTEATLIWDGKDSGGNTVLSGIYIYQIAGGGKVFHGALLVAR